MLILLQIPDFPREILEMVSQHHGDTVLQYFYNKSKSKVDSYFRYRSAKPQTVEAAVLMIADCVEATSRALSSNGELETSEDKNKVILNTIKRLEEDEQLDNLTYGQGRIIKKVLYKELENIYHKREIYGGEKGEDKE